MLHPRISLIPSSDRAALFEDALQNRVGGQLLETKWRELQLPNATTRTHLMLHKCPHITAECVNHTVTSQGLLTSTNSAVFPGPKATGYIIGKRRLRAA